MERNKALLIGSVSHSDLVDYAEIIYNFLKDNQCVRVPKRVAFKVAGILEKKEISFFLKNEPKTNWVLFHYLYCHCG